MKQFTTNSAVIESQFNVLNTDPVYIQYTQTDANAVNQAMASIANAQ